MPGIEVDVLSDAIGVEIRGVDLSREPDRDYHRGHLYFGVCVCLDIVKATWVDAQRIDP